MHVINRAHICKTLNLSFLIFKFSSKKGQRGEDSWTLFLSNIDAKEKLENI
jgi:hypothetical protein